MPRKIKLLHQDLQDLNACLLLTNTASQDTHHGMESFNLHRKLAEGKIIVKNWYHHEKMPRKIKLLHQDLQDLNACLLLTNTASQDTHHGREPLTYLGGSGVGGG
jgi:hypothetical protein